MDERFPASFFATGFTASRQKHHAIELKSGLCAFNGRGTG
jgi:hypothetical protein